MGADLTIRLAQPGDREAMERICAHTWQWGDYIPLVWLDWLKDERGVVIVGESAGRVVALSKVTFLTPSQCWLEGMRVDPEYRRRGTAWAFLEYSIAYAHERGAHVVRLATGHDNMPVHHLTARAGMEHVGAYALWQAGPLVGGAVSTVLAPEHEMQVQALLTGSEVLATTRGLFSVDWAWQELSGDRVSELLGVGQVVGVFGPDSSLGALALVQQDTEDSTVWIGLADGTRDAVCRLACAVRGDVAELGMETASVMMPDLAWLQDAFRAAGFAPGGWEGELWVFERRFAQDGQDHVST